MSAYWFCCRAGAGMHRPLCWENSSLKVDRGEAGITPSHLLAILQGALYFLVGLVLAQRVDGPYGRRKPAYERDLQDKADNAGDGAPDREKGKPRQQQGNDKSHGGYGYVGKTRILTRP